MTRSVTTLPSLRGGKRRSNPALRRATPAHEGNPSLRREPKAGLLRCARNDGGAEQQPRHCEERSDEAIQLCGGQLQPTRAIHFCAARKKLDCFAALAMTGGA